MNADFTAQRRQKLDRLGLDPQTGELQAVPRRDGTVAAVSNIVYSTDVPPPPDTVPEGTVWLRYIP